MPDVPHGTPNHHGTWEDRRKHDRKEGQPYPPFPLCSYCGSLPPEKLVEAIRSGCQIGGSDWKYGWPHKFYVDFPNPNPDEQRECGWDYKGGEKITRYSTFPTLHLKFYAEHLANWVPLLEQSVRDEIMVGTGINFNLIGGKLVYNAPYHGYQKM